MTNQKNKILSLTERASDYKDRGKEFPAIDCMIQAIALLAETLPEPEAKPGEKNLVPVPEEFSLENQVALDSFKRNLTDIDQMVIWKLGLAAWDAAKKWKAKFPHE